MQINNSWSVAVTNIFAARLPGSYQKNTRETIWCYCFFLVGKRMAACEQIDNIPVALGSVYKILLIIAITWSHGFSESMCPMREVVIVSYPVHVTARQNLWSLRPRHWSKTRRLSTKKIPPLFPLDFNQHTLCKAVTHTLVATQVTKRYYR